MDDCAFATKSFILPAQLLLHVTLLFACACDDDWWWYELRLFAEQFNQSFFSRGSVRAYVDRQTATEDGAAQFPLSRRENELGISLICGRCRCWVHIHEFLRWRKRWCRGKAAAENKMPNTWVRAGTEISGDCCRYTLADYMRWR